MPTPRRVNISQAAEQQANTNNETGIFSNNFGGLNTTASDINCPYTDSPLLYNIDVKLSGQLEKRRGTELIDNQSVTAANTTGYGLIPFTTGLRYDFVVEKIKKDINIYFINNDTVTNVVTKSDVWDDDGATVKPNYTRTTEIEPRLIIATGVNQPVQLRWVERQEVATSANTSIAIPEATRLENSSTSNSVFFVNRVRTVPTLVSYSAGTLTVTFSSSLSIGDVVDVVFITWQHMVEALYLKGDRISQQQSRFHVVKTDQNVEIPEEIRTDPIYNYPTSEFEYGIQVYQSTQWNDTFTFDSALTPATNSQYSFGNGSRYDSTAGGTVTPAPFFATFGDIIGTGTTDPTEVLFIRRHDLNRWFNGGVDIAGDDITVFADDTQLTQSINAAGSTATYRSYWLIDSSNNVATSTATASRFITWESSAQVGIEEEANVYIIHTTTNYIGTNANTTVDDYTDGACEPLFGVGVYFDYFSGAFARNVSVFEDRLIFSGIPNNPLKVLLSELADTTVPFRPYRKFQIETLSNLATDAYDINISSRTDDFVTGLVTWQASLIIFTRQTVHRIFFSATTGLNSTSTGVSLIATSGLVNPYSVVTANNFVYYLTDLGVSTLSLGVDSQEFQIEDVSEKIRGKFGITANPVYEDQSFLTYDTVTEKLYVALPQIGETKYATQLLVYGIYRRSWTEYLTDNNFRLYHAIQYRDFGTGKGFIAACSLASDTKKGLLKFEADKFLDFYTESTADGLTTDFVIDVNLASVTYTTTDQLYTYRTDDITQSGAFRLFDSTEVNDTYVTLDGTALTFGTDYEKHRNNTIYLIQNPGAGKTLVISHRAPMTDYEVTRAYYEITTPIAYHAPVHVTVDNYIQFQDNDYTVTGGTSTTVSFTTDPVNNAIVQIGFFYPTFYRTPLLTLDTLANLKRIKHLYVYFDNELGLDEWTAADVNSASNQDPPEIIQTPKQRLNANLLVTLENDYSADVQADVFGFYSLVYDDSFFDVSPSTAQFRRYTLFKEHLLGIGYSYSLGVWSYDESAFNLAAWQITNRVGAEKYINIASS